MKRRKSFLVALVALVLVGTLFGSAAAENKKIVIGATTPPHAIILEALVEDLKAEGFDLEILELTDYVTGNPATSAGDLDANYFQHGPYLKLYNDSVPDDQKLAAVIGVHYEPFGLYAGTKATLEELAEIITWKQLGLYKHPIIILNTNNYYSSLLEMFDNMIEQNFMHKRYHDMWQVVNTPEEAIEELSKETLSFSHLIKFDKA